MTISGSAVEELEAEFAKKVALIRRDLEAKVGPIEELLKSYRAALESERCREFASAHSLRAGRAFMITPEAAARALLRAVSELPELKRKAQEDQAQSEPELVSPMGGSAPDGGAATVGPTSQTATQLDESEAPRRTIYDVLPKLVEAADQGKIVVVGAFSGRTKELPPPLESVTEWIDTARDGVHAIGNLPQRIRRGGIVALIICEQAISHQHSEPLVQAARTHTVPIGFAGKGGSGGISRALEAVEAQLP